MGKWCIHLFRIKYKYAYSQLGQYPSRSKDGDQYTIKQALKYTKNATESAQLTLIFNIRIQEEVVAGVVPDNAGNKLKIYPNPTAGVIKWDSQQDWQLMNATGHELKKGNDTSLDLSGYTNGLYILKLGDFIMPVIKE